MRQESPNLGERALKHNEDALDAIVCLYIAGLYQAGYGSKVFGKASEGHLCASSSLHHQRDRCLIKRSWRFCTMLSLTTILANLYRLCLSGIGSLNKVGSAGKVAG